MKVIRWTARILSALILAFHTLSFLGDRSSITLSTTDMINLTLWAVILLGMLIAWKWEGMGSFIIIGGFLVQALLNPMILSMWAMWMAPLAGVLFLICWTGSKKKKAITPETP